MNSALRMQMVMLLLIAHSAQYKVGHPQSAGKSTMNAMKISVSITAHPACNLTGYAEGHLAYPAFSIKTTEFRHSHLSNCVTAIEGGLIILFRYERDIPHRGNLVLWHVECTRKSMNSDIKTRVRRGEQGDWYVDVKHGARWVTKRTVVGTKAEAREAEAAYRMEIQKLRKSLAVAHTGN